MDIQCQIVTHHIVTFCDFLGNFQKLSTKNTTKLENSLNSYGFLNFYLFGGRHCSMDIFNNNGVIPTDFFRIQLLG